MVYAVIERTCSVLVMLGHLEDAKAAKKGCGQGKDRVQQSHSSLLIHKWWRLLLSSSASQGQVKNNRYDNHCFLVQHFTLLECGSCHWCRICSIRRPNVHGKASLNSGGLHHTLPVLLTQRTSTTFLSLLPVPVGKLHGGNQRQGAALM